MTGEGLPPPTAFCRACKSQLRLVEDGPHGELYLCDGCKTTLEVDRAHATIVVDRDEGPAATTVNGGPKP